MSAKVKVNEIIDNLVFDMDEYESFVKRSTGEVIVVSEKALRDAEEIDEETMEELPLGQEEELEVAIAIIEDGDEYIELPNQNDVNEYRMMENFCFTLNDSSIKTNLLSAIKGKGAFRRFKDRVIDLGVADKWYSYRDECYKEFVIEWCKENGLEYTE